MKKLAFIFFLIFSLANVLPAQTPDQLLEQIKPIKLLSSGRENVVQALSGYEASDDDYQSQTFSNDDWEINVSYSKGKCSDYEDEDDARDLWAVAEWKVTRIEVYPTEPLTLETLKLDLSRFKKEQLYSDIDNSFVYHLKSVGLAVWGDDEGVKRVIYFPPTSQSKKLCEGMSKVKEFYSENSWFGKLKPGPSFIACNFGGNSNLDGLILSSERVMATEGKKISIEAMASDPENDVLTYVYKVSGGKIVGTGSKVVWDLSGLSSGLYKLTAGVDDGAGVVGSTVTKMVRID